MAKLTLTDILGQYASTTQLNANFAAIETALENTLSRDGTTPNTMSDDLDMNSNKITNLAQPTNDNDAARKLDVDIAIATSLPDQTGNANKIIKSNGTTATWQTQIAADVTNTPAGNIVATTVQDAINELDTDKVPETDFSAFGKTLVDDADAAAARTTLGLGTVATESTVPITKGGTGQVTAQSAIDALTQVSGATNEYVLTKDTTSGSAEWKQIPSEAADIETITATVAANALTCGTPAGSVDFRDATLTSGAVTSITHGALSLVVPDTATLGTVSAVQSRLYLLKINNAGTVELAIVNSSGGNDLSETGVISTTALSTGSDSANVIYSTTARTNVAYRIIGLIESTQATAGTWATDPGLIQGAGGNALTAMSSLGYGQTWQASGKSLGTTYYNTTGKPIVNCLTFNQSVTAALNVTINGFVVAAPSANSANNGFNASVTFVVPPYQSYSCTSGVSLVYWTELR